MRTTLHRRPRLRRLVITPSLHVALTPPGRFDVRWALWLALATLMRPITHRIWSRYRIEIDRELAFKVERLWGARSRSGVPTR